MKRFALCCAVLMAPLAFAAPADDKSLPVAFRAEARVEVDASGKLLKVEAAQDLPEGIQDYIEKELSTWQYRRRLGDKASGVASTWVMLGVCAAPVPAGGYSMGLAFERNGPRAADGRSFRVTDGIFTAVSRFQYEGDVKIHFMINPDGSTTVESIEGLKRGAGGKEISRELKSWVSRMEFDTETVDGKPVGTQAVLPVQFRLGGGEDRASLLEKITQSAQCKMATMAADPGETSDVAFESEVSIVPSS